MIINYLEICIDAHICINMLCMQLCLLESAECVRSGLCLLVYIFCFKDVQSDSVYQTVVLTLLYIPVICHIYAR